MLSGAVKECIVLINPGFGKVLEEEDGKVTGATVVIGIWKVAMILRREVILRTMVTGGLDGNKRSQ